MDAPITANLCSRSISQSRNGASPPLPSDEEEEEDASPAPAMKARDDEDAPAPGPVRGSRPYSFLYVDRLVGIQGLGFRVQRDGGAGVFFWGRLLRT